MTDFELESLKLAKETVAVLHGQELALIASAIIALLAVVPGLYGLYSLIKQVKLGQLNSLLLLEQDMSRRRERVSEISREISEVRSSPSYNTNHSVLDPVIREFNEAVENYLNSLDRLCFCIIRNKFSEHELRSDYRDVVKAALKDFPGQFQAGSPFRYILRVHDRWADT